MNTNHKAIYSSIIASLFSFAYASGALITVETEAQYEAQVLNNPRPVVVKFAASWCSVCSEVKEPFAQLAQEKEFENIVFAKVDIDQLAAISDRYDINAVPTFIFFQNGQKKLQEAGVKEMKKFKDTMNANIIKAFGDDNRTQDIPGSLKRADNESTLLGTMVASLKSAYNSVAGAVSSVWTRLVS